MNIGLIGLAGAGKSALADRLVNEHGYVSMGFADPLRAMAAAINPIVESEFFGGGVLTTRYDEAIDLYGYTGAKAHFPEMRRFLQALGTDAVREVLGANTWIDVAERTIRRHLATGQRVVVTDVRFPNEADLLKLWLGFDLVRVERPGAGLTGANAGHPSETALTDHPVDHTIVNDGTLDDLHDAADSLVGGVLV